MKLKLKHLVDHANHGGKLRLLDDDSKFFDDYIRSIDFLHETIETEEGCCLELSDFGQTAFMVKRPLSDLTKKIEVDGEKGIPIKELLSEVHVDYDDFEIIVTDEKIRALYCKEEYLYIDFEDIRFTEWWVMQKLFEWNFDVYGLIPEGMAIDINTI